MIAPLTDECAHARQVIGVTRMRFEDARDGVHRIRVDLDDFDVGRAALERLEDVPSASAADDARALGRGERIRGADDVVG